MSAQVTDTAKGVVVLVGHRQHAVQLPCSLADVVAVEAAPQGPLDAAAKVGQRVS